MTKPALFLIILCLIGGIIFGAKQVSKPQAQLVSHGEYSMRSSQAQVVYALRRISRGSKIDANMLGERSIERWKQPANAVPIGYFAINRIARNDIELGQILLMSDLYVEPTGSLRIDNSSPSR